MLYPLPSLQTLIGRYNGQETPWLRRERKEAAPDGRRGRLMDLYAFEGKQFYAHLAASRYPRGLKRTR
jgi:hypothetical protein